MAQFPRIAGRLNNTIDLNVSFFNGGQASDPFAIIKIDIYKESVKTENLVETIVLPDPADDAYPSPLVREEDSDGNILPGVFHLLWEVPANIEAPNIYFDVWRFVGNDPTPSGTGGTDITGSELSDDSYWTSQCNRFWLYPESYSADDNLIIPRFAFEPLDTRLRKPEKRTIEVGVMPLPLYDFDQRLLNLIPLFSPKVRIETENNELIAAEHPARMGIRSGSYRTNPFTIQFTLDTSEFYIGSYVYRIIIDLPNGETRVSDDLRFMVI